MHVYIAGGCADARMCVTCVLSENPHFVGWNYSPCLICGKMVSLMSPDYFSSDPCGGGLLCRGRYAAHAPRSLLDNCIDYRAPGECVMTSEVFTRFVLVGLGEDGGDAFRSSGRRLWSNISNAFPNKAVCCCFLGGCGEGGILTPSDTPYFTP